jgi:hypothetical protein
MHTNSRRQFLKTTALAAGASAIVAPALARSLGANDRIRVGIVGLRGRGKSHIDAIHAMEAENVELAAMCDCDETVLDGSLDAYAQRSIIGMPGA